MCGIFGMFLNQIVDKTNIHTDKIRHFLNHRGPDDNGCLILEKNSNEFKKINPSFSSLCNAQVVFWHTRLAIMDKTTNGSQPMLSKNGKFLLSFNGEIYNYLELKKKLINLGFKFNGNSDTEVLLCAWQAWGKKVLSSLSGMFSFSIVDLINRKIYLVRDIFGIKPLYWTKNVNGFFFSSEIKPLLEINNCKPKAELSTTLQYLKYGYTDRNKSTFFSDIHKIEPAKIYEFSLDNFDKLNVYTYWDLKPQKKCVSFKTASKQLKDIFLTSVKQHLRSNVPIGLTLSGGIDSTSILCSILHSKYKNQLKIFSYLSKNSDQNEETWVDYLSSKYKLKINKIYIENQNFVENIKNVIKIQEEPFASTGIYAQYEVYKKINQNKIKVNLDGQGADEIFAGYPTYISTRLVSAIKKRDLSKIYWIFKFHPTMFLRIIGNLLPSRASIFIQNFLNISFSSKTLNEKWFRIEDLDFSSNNLNFTDDIFKNKLKELFFDKSLPSLLRYLDKNSMSNSVESRVPFLSKDIVEFAFSLPEEYLIDNSGRSKAILRHAMEDIVPKKILERKDKIGFSVPENEWLSCSSKWLNGAKKITLDNLPMIKKDKLNLQFDKALSSNRIMNNELWRYINLSIWAEEFNVRFN